MTIHLIKVYKKRLIASLVPIVLIGAAASTGCQPIQKEEAAPSVSVESEIPKTLKPSATALAAIEEFQTDYVDRMLILQQNQLDEYQALKAAAISPADITTSDKTSLDTTASSKKSNPVNTSQQEDKSSNPTSNDAVVSKEVDSTEVTLTELPLATTPLVQPEVLTVPELKSRYQQAMQSLYFVDDTPISSQDMDTLLSIATVIPDVFKTDDLARRLVLKTPALARLLKQYQIWEQMERQQSAELEALNQARIQEQEKQAKDFEVLMTEFDSTIKGYDEQIAKYEKTLTEFE